MATLQPIFHWADYLVFSSMLAASASIGVFYAVSSSKRNTSGEYMLASRQMGFFPVAMSLLASLFTGIYIQGSVAETYYRGAIFLTGTIIPLIITGVISGRVFMPKFYEMKLTSIYQYLDLRFNAVVRNCCLLVGFIYMILHSGIATYAASLVLTTVTSGKLSVLASAIILSAVCTFYTVIGGIKAVLWADCFQMCLIFASLMAAVLQGAANVGFTEIWSINLEGGRLNFFDFNPDPRVYVTFWTVFIGGVFSWLPSMVVLQYQVQRYLTCKSQTTAHLSFGLFIVGCVGVTALCILAAMSLYAIYVECDPFENGTLAFKDGLLPYYLLDAFSHLPGIPGLLVSGLCSAALSTTSSILNAVATITTKHIISQIWTDLPDVRYLFITKMIALFFGALNVGTVLLVARLGPILPAVIGIIGITNGPVCGVFILGFFFPRANSKGTVVGFIVGISVGLWLLIGSLFYQPVAPSLPVSTEGCASDMMTNTSVMLTTMAESFSNVSTTVVTPVDNSGNFIIQLYRVSRLWYPTICIMLVIILGLVTSLIFNAILGKPEVKPSLLWSWKKSCCCCLTKPETNVEDEKNLFSDIMSDVTTVGKGEPVGIDNPGCSGCDVCKSPTKTTHL